MWQEIVWCVLNFKKTTTDPFFEVVWHYWSGRPRPFSALIFHVFLQVSNQRVNVSTAVPWVSVAVRALTPPPGAGKHQATFCQHKEREQPAYCYLQQQQQQDQIQNSLCELTKMDPTMLFRAVQFLIILKMYFICLLAGSLNSIPVTLRESGIMTANRNKINNSIYLYF